jgi:hypothetical protein
MSPSLDETQAEWRTRAGKKTLIQLPDYVLLFWLNVMDVVILQANLWTCRQFRITVAIDGLGFTVAKFSRHIEAPGTTPNRTPR